MAMINCPECDKLISDQAVTCPNCGCPINSVQPQPATEAPPVQNTVPPQANVPPQQYSALYPQIKAFKEQVNKVYILSIIAIILSMGIGFILAIISIVSMGKIVPIQPEAITSPFELAEYQAAERKLKTARILSGITLIIAGLTLIISFIAGIFSQM